MSVLSISNAQIKQVRSLHQKKYRQKYNQFIVEGFKSVQEFLGSALKCELLFAHSDSIHFFQGLVNQNVLFACSEKQLQQITALKNHQQVVGVFQIPEIQPSIDSPNLILCLDDIRDPGNLGTIIRTAEWFGLKEIVLSHECADVFNPKVVQASMGSLSRLQVRYENLVDYIASKKNYKLLLADMVGESYKKASYKNTIIVIGNEGKGVSLNIRALHHQAVSIPRVGEAESLNAAISAAILLSEAITQ